MSQEMKAFPGMKASQKLNFNHSEVIINSAPAGRLSWNRLC